MRKGTNEARPTIETIYDGCWNTDVVAMPGILTHDHSWLGPIMPILQNQGNVHSMLYGPGNFNPDLAVQEAIKKSQESLEIGHRTILLASSLGGDLAPFVAEGLKTAMNDDAVDLSAIILDAPYGAETLCPLPKPLRSLMDKYPPTWQPGRIARAIGNKTVMAHLMTLPSGLPKLQETTYPKDSEGRALLMKLAYPYDELLHGSEPTDEQLFRAITEIAKTGLSDNDFSAYVTQIEYIIGAAKGGMLGEAIKSGLDGLAVYIMASELNGTVVQPFAKRKWLDQKPDMSVIDIQSPHVATTQMMPEWSAALSQAFEDLR
ncbi:hypothetical protein EOL96_02200 [Candidatus Saccharibacteria bacterium]|nr:hypothetical protein [Candidatus Saccharibacteria bacterium]